MNKYIYILSLLFLLSCIRGKSVKKLDSKIDIKNYNYKECFIKGGCGNFIIYGFVDSLTALVIVGDSKNGNLDLYKTQYINAFTDTLLIKEIRLDKYKSLNDVQLYCSDVVDLFAKEKEQPIYYDMKSGFIYLKSNNHENTSISVKIQSGIFLSENRIDSIKIDNVLVDSVEIGNSPG